MWWLWLACGGQPEVPTTPAKAPPDGWNQIVKDVPYFTSLVESPGLASQVIDSCNREISTQRECIRASRNELEHQGMLFTEPLGRRHVQTITANDTGGIAILLDTEINVTHGRLDQLDIQGVPGTETGPQVEFLPPEALKSPPLLSVTIVDATGISVSGPDGRPVVYRRKEAAK